MEPHGLQRTLHGSPGLRRRALGLMSTVTLLMTIPQVWTIWANRQAMGVSALSWGAYLASAVLWLWHGIDRRDPNIYLPCIAWIILDGAVLAGTVVYG